MIKIKISASTPEELRAILNQLTGVVTNSQKHESLNLVTSDELTEVNAGPLQDEPVETEISKPKVTRTRKTKEDAAPELKETLAINTSGYTLEDVRKIVVAKDNAEAVKPILKDFGAVRVVELKPENYAEFIARVEAEVPNGSIV